MTTNDRPMIYTAAQRPDGTPVPVTEWRCLFYFDDDFEPGLPPDDYPYTTEERPVSWALILPGDVVIDQHGRERTVVTFTDRFGEPDVLVKAIFNSGTGTVFPVDKVTLIVTDEIPEHRRGNPAWQWPTP